MDPMFVRRKKESSDNGVVLPPDGEPLAIPSAQPTASSKTALADTTSDFRPRSTKPLSTMSYNTSSTKRAWWKRISMRTRLLILIPLGIILVVGGALAAFMLTRDKPKPAPAPAPAPVVEKIEEPPAPTTVASTLTGLQVDPELNKRGVTAIMIENSIDARPQAGLIDAGVVYEAIAEGGITRFLTLFQEAQPDYIGPVRSARPYYVNWLKSYNAAYLHVGGSPEALQMISNYKIRDLGDAYLRISTRFAPHNAYSNMAKIDAARAARGFDSPAFTGFARKPEAPSKTQTATTIDLKISSTLYNIHYDYDAAINSYKRSEGGKAHTDDKTGKQLTPKVVVALIIPYSIHSDGIHSVYQSIGSGKGTIFQDGIHQDITWSKPTVDSPLVFLDAAGKEIPINPGQTWITALGQASMLTFSAPAPAAATPTP